MNLARTGFVFAVLAACASGHYATVDPGHAAFVIPHHIAEGKGEGEDLPADAGPPPTHAASLPAAPPLSGSAPDPEPLNAELLRLILAEEKIKQIQFVQGDVTDLIRLRAILEKQRQMNVALDFVLRCECGNRVDDDDVYLSRAYK